MLPVTITHITYAKRETSCDPDAEPTASWSHKLEIEFEFSDIDHEGQKSRRKQTLVFRRYSADTLAAFFG